MELADSDRGFPKQCPIAEERSRVRASTDMSSQVSQGAVLASAIVCTLGAACGPHAGVDSFTASPPLTCPNGPVVLEWKVTGPASLRAEPRPASWSDGPVPSQGSRTAQVAQDTQFIVSALDANPASGNAVGRRPVKVTALNQEKGASAACDPQTRVCRGSFTLSSGGASISRLANPSLQRDGALAAREVCVTPPGGAKICVAANASVAVGAPADGTWTLETTLDPTEALSPPPQLHITVDFGCPPKEQS